MTTALMVTPVFARSEAAAVSYADEVRSRARAMLAEGDVEGLAALRDTAIVSATSREHDAVFEADSAHRLAVQLDLLPAGLREFLSPVLLADENESLARTMAYAVQAGGDRGSDDVPAAYGVLRQLIEEFGIERVREFDNLAAALAVVHDREHTFRVNRVTTTSPGPLLLFAFYSTNARSMTFDPRNVPAEALVWVVDATASVEDLQWALDRYRRDNRIGERFFEISYDYENFRTGRPKRAVELGYKLPQILQHGGVCADQAYFAMTVAKAKGMPSAYVRARGRDSGHAWVGFVEAQGRRPQWNFDHGRYPEYQRLRGTLIDPQSGLVISDATAGVLAGFMAETDQQRWTAEALVDAARRVSELSLAGATVEPDRFGTRPQRARSIDPLTVFILLEEGLRTAPDYAMGWAALGELAEQHPMTNEGLNYWLTLIDRLCGREFPDFFVEASEPLIDSAEDPAERVDAWQWVFDRLERGRPDLAARARVRQGAAFEAAEDKQNAWAAYDDVLRRFADEGPFIAEALSHMERMLTEGGMPDDIGPMYERAWGMIEAPNGRIASSFARGSTWYRVGYMYQAAMQRTGDNATRARVIERLENMR